MLNSVSVLEPVAGLDDFILEISLEYGVDSGSDGGAMIGVRSFCHSARPEFWLVIHSSDRYVYRWHFILIWMTSMGRDYLLTRVHR